VWQAVPDSLRGGALGVPWRRGPRLALVMTGYGPATRRIHTPGSLIDWHSGKKAKKVLQLCGFHRRL